MVDEDGAAYGKYSNLPAYPLGLIKTLERVWITTIYYVLILTDTGFTTFVFSLVGVL